MQEKEVYVILKLKLKTKSEYYDSIHEDLARTMNINIRSIEQKLEDYEVLDIIGDLKDYFDE